MNDFILQDNDLRVFSMTAEKRTRSNVPMTSNEKCTLQNQV